MISRDYKPEDYPLPLTPEQQEYLITEATLEALMREPGYFSWRHSNAEMQAAYHEMVSWERIAPLGDGR